MNWLRPTHGRESRPDPPSTFPLRRLWWAVLGFGLSFGLGMLAEKVWAAAAQTITVVDGDTIYVGEERVRIVGLDAPETYQARCDAERQLGYKATNFLRSLVAGGNVRLERQAKPDRYGRTLAKVYVGGRDVAGVMVAAGLAVAYDCPRGRCPRRIDWCQRLEARQ